MAGLRVATQNLRPIDMYYEADDDKATKSRWGRKVLKKYEQKRLDAADEDSEDAEADGEREDEAREICYGEDKKEDELLKQCPWLAWDRESKSPKDGLKLDT